MLNRYQSTTLTILLAAMLMLFCATDAWACPTCKSALEDGSSHIVNGYFWSIIFMMSMPFTIVTAMSIYFYVLVLRARWAARKQATGPAPAPVYKNRVSASTLAEILEQPASETLAQSQTEDSPYVGENSAEPERELLEV